MLRLVPLVAPESRAWVNDIKDPKQKALALAVPALCDLVGMLPEELSRGRGRVVTDRDIRVNMHRTVVLGAVVSLGRDLGLRRVDLQGKQEEEAGCTEVQDLFPFHRFSLRRSQMRFEDFIAEGGVIGRAFKTRYLQIQQEVLAMIRTSKKSPTHGVG